MTAKWYQENHMAVKFFDEALIFSSHGSFFWQQAVKWVSPWASEASRRAWRGMGCFY